MQNFFLENGCIDVLKHYENAYKISQKNSFGAMSNFSGIIRDDDGVDGLSFDIYVPILKSWFDTWEQKAIKQECKLYFAHSINDVLVGQSSYFAAAMSKHRKISLKVLNDFVEDFKHNAPIWKYDLVNGERKYAFNRSFKLAGAGFL